MCTDFYPQITNDKIEAPEREVICPEITQPLNYADTQVLGSSYIFFISFYCLRMVGFFLKSDRYSCFPHATD